VLQCVAACRSMLQCVAVCCSVLQCVAVSCIVLQHFNTRQDNVSKTFGYFLAKFLKSLCFVVCCSVLQCVAVCSSVLQCAVVCCSVLQCVAACCSVLQCVAELRHTPKDNIAKTFGVPPIFNILDCWFHSYVCDMTHPI